MTDQSPYPEEEGIVKDEFYVQNEEHGGDEYDPRQDMEEEETEDNVDVVEEDPADLDQNATIEPKRFRDSTYNIAQKKGFYYENETDVTGGEVSEQSVRDKDASRQLSSLVAASHRKNRAPEQKRQSALKASELHEKVTGHPLKINEEGEVQ
ncbi:hypothetical protein RhiirA5_350245 [Rhizophagus irregularis]|uniref:Uncharacterized protein n=3 Tax=Rhizophagus irregularis TaxID=588596 RepID=U9UX49_RHIID|nr:hypothetical protein GLOIN_2v1595141 [Rhizophagus irregularis DAOM 181602=DAOM 197198]EXX75696.1 hypothetical protein RirG_039580 [Rhizophagus irregularis DAOM 197198w]PKC14504.1 hypothetical protein RhiirA5_350245 [Rhizophagus irregularis]PKC71263.1 hypothetical protein RhiirA1_413395 [Rhizophagus irregularis]PKK78980.1 hypothetical protein RhiirC2_728290 [Rhizophagus irregularis]PKY15164.1 hypothetical protein RhiirB3_401247 [Rhizophagus irregularis]|eukprot:XP_025179302.1 hypothetical protein GLOIN_2v1595141 [Rhizophagus irregularis DAOM 181602=DAOM 197198]